MSTNIYVQKYLLGCREERKKETKLPTILIEHSLKSKTHTDTFYPTTTNSKVVLKLEELTSKQSSLSLLKCVKTA